MLYILTENTPNFNASAISDSHSPFLLLPMPDDFVRTKSSHGIEQAVSPDITEATFIGY